MPEEFDPYRKWLGIPPEEQPPHHYRLLGIALFEDDPDVIENAADRQMAHVRTYQSGKHGPLSQKLLNELSLAKVCLLKADKKAEYDDDLRQSMGAVEAVEEETPPAPVPRPAAVHAPAPVAPIPRPAVAAPVVPPNLGQPTFPTASAPAATAVAEPRGPIPKASAPSMRSRARKQSSPLPLIFGGIGALGLVAVIALVAMLSGGNKKSSSGTPDKPREVVNNGNRTEVPPREEKPVRPPEPPREEPKKPPGNDFVVSPPVDPGLEIPREVRFRNALEGVRGALKNRAWVEAERLLDDAENLKEGRQQEEEYEHFRRVKDRVARFWEATRKGAYAAPKNQPLEAGEFKFELVGLEGERTTIKFANESTESFNFNDLPAAIAAVFARFELPREEAETDVVIATFLATDGQGNAPWRLKTARELAQRAREKGGRTRTLEREIELLASTTSDFIPEPEDPEPGEPFPVPEPEPEPEPSDPFPKTEPVVDNRREVPSGPELLAATRRFREAYGERLARARSPDALRELIISLFNASEETDDFAYKYVLLEQARERATALVSTRTLVAIVREMAEIYKLNLSTEMQSAFTELQKRVRTPDDRRDLSNAASELFFTAVVEKNYADAVAIGELALRAAKTAGDNDTAQRVEIAAKPIEEFVTARQRGEEAFHTLERRPDDSSAKTMLGRYLCYYHNDWKQGLAMLAAGSGEDSALAKRDVDQPASLPEQITLAEDWLSEGRRRRGLIEIASHRRARYWYQKAIEQSEGEQRQSLQQALQQVEAFLQQNPGLEP